MDVVVDKLEKKEEALKGPFKNPATNKGGLDFKKVGGEESKGGVVTFTIPTGPAPAGTK